jgi:hypothetical protein
MRVRQIYVSEVSSLTVLVFATALVSSPTLSYASDLAWHTKSEGVPAKESSIGSERTFERTGTAEFKKEKATYVCNGMNHSAAVPDKRKWDQQCVFRFDDLSAITTHTAGTFDNVTQETKGAGQFVSGSGRFEGITGEVTVVGRFVGYSAESDWVGSYSLPAESRGFQ